MPLLNNDCLRTPMVVALLVVLLAGLGCGDDTEEPVESSDEPVREVESDLGHYFVRFAPSQEPIAFNEYVEMTVEVFNDEALSEPAEAAELEVDARVEKLNGRLPTVPVVDKTGPGVFRVSGLLFHVPRKWELRFNILEDGFEERATVLIDPTRGFETGSDPTGYFSEDEVSRILSFSPEGGPSLPEEPSNAYADDPAAAKLGRFLFFDTRLSANGEVACASCHAPDQGFGDDRQLAVGVGQVPRHAPTVLNSAFNRYQFWDGRTDSLWSQALQPLEADVEHGTNRMSVVHLIASDEDYRAAYEAIFGDLPDVSDEERFPDDARPVADDDDHPEHEAWMDMEPADRKAVSRVFANIGKAIAAYERAIVRVNAPFDEFAQGLREQDEAKMNAIDPSAKAGLKLFLGEAQCDLCHNGAMLSNFEFHNLGMTTRDWMPGGDEGRYAGAEQLESDVFNSMGEFSDAPDTFYPELAYLRRGEFRQKGAFKTSTLRNVEVTAPYMHGGHFETLSEVINFYADLQEDPEVGRRDPLTQPFSIDSEQTSQLEAFLKTLTGEELPEELVRAPATPVLDE